ICYLMPERSAHRGFCGASLLNTARGTPKVRWTCGRQRRVSHRCHARLIPGTGPVRGRVALVPRGAKVRGSIATPASRAPSDFFWGDAQGGKEGEPGACGKNPGRAAEGRPAGAKRRRGGVGRCRKPRSRGKRDPTRARCARPPSPLQGRVKRTSKLG